MFSILDGILLYLYMFLPVRSGMFMPKPYHVTNFVKNMAFLKYKTVNIWHSSNYIWEDVVRVPIRQLSTNGLIYISNTDYKYCNILHVCQTKPLSKLSVYQTDVFKLIPMINLGIIIIQRRIIVCTAKWRTIISWFCIILTWFIFIAHQQILLLI